MDTLVPELADALLNARRAANEEPLPPQGTREYYQELARRSNAKQRERVEMEAARERLRAAGVRVVDDAIPVDPSDFEELRPHAMREVAKQLKHRDPKIRRAMTEQVLQFTDGRYRDKEDDGIREIVYLTPALLEEVDEAIAKVEASDEPKAPFVPAEA